MAALEAGRQDELRTLLASMNRRPGVVDPENRLVPFGRFERLHFARFLVLEDPTAGDIAAHGVTSAPPSRVPGVRGGLRRAGEGLSRRARPASRAGASPDLLSLPGLPRARRSARVDAGARPAGGHALRELGGANGAADPRGERAAAGARGVCGRERPRPRSPGAGPGVRRSARLRRAGAPGRPAHADGPRADPARLAGPEAPAPDRRAGRPAPGLAAPAPVPAGLRDRASPAGAVGPGDRAAAGRRAREAPGRAGGPRRHQSVQRHGHAQARAGFAGRP